MNQPEAAKAVAILRAAFPGLRFPAETIALYEHLLADLDFELVQRALHRLISRQTTAFIPTIGAIRQEAATLALGDLRSGEEAWGDVLAEIRRTGAYGAPRLKDPVCAEAVRSMGWRNLCLGDNEAADRARFCALYEQLRNRERTSKVTSPKLELPPAVKGLLQGVLRPIG